MRILLVTDWNRGRGGAENYLSLLRAGLVAAGDEVRLLTSSAGTAGDGAAEYVAFGTENVAAQTFLQIVNPFAVASLKRALAELRPDVVLVNMFAHHLSPAIFRPLAKVPTVLLLTDYKCVCPLGSKLLPDESLCGVRAGWVCRQNGCVSTLHWLRDRPRYGLLRLAVRSVTRVVACSEWVRQELARDGIMAEVTMLPVTPPAPVYRHEPAADPVFVFCGRLDREKGTALLLRAFARLTAEFPSARLRLIGVGPLRSELDGILGALALKHAVEFRGWLSLAEIEMELSKAWALVVPSLWAEPLGLVAIEAIVRGVPVVASASGGLGEIVEEGVNGLLFPNNDEAALFERLKAIASKRAFPNRTLPDEVVARAHERFGVEQHIASMRRLFRGVIAERTLQPTA